VEYIVIDKTTKKAIYLQIADSIRSAILSGRLKDMDKLPTEKELCSFFGISDIVVKRAYSELVEHKLVSRIQGSGTFITLRKSFVFPIYPKKNISHIPFVCPHVFKRVLLFESQKNNTSIRGLLSIDTGKNLYKAKYLVYIDKTPAFIQTLYLPRSEFPNLSISQISETSIFTLLEEQFDHQIDHAKNAFYPVVLYSTESMLLNVSKDSAAHLVRSTLFSASKPIAYIETLLPGHYTKFEVTI